MGDRVTVTMINGRKFSGNWDNGPQPDTIRIKPRFGRHVFINGNDVVSIKGPEYKD